MCILQFMFFCFDVGLAMIYSLSLVKLVNLKTHWCTFLLQWCAVECSVGQCNTMKSSAVWFINCSFSATQL